MYIKYEEYKRNYYDSQESLNDLINKKEELFGRTQPQSTNYDKDKTNGGTPSNTFDTYIIAKDDVQLDERIEEAKKILKVRKLLLDSKEEDLRKSKDWLDKIYIYSYLDKLSIRKIEKKVPFGRSEIQRKLEKIEKSINLGQKGTKGMVI